MLATLPKGPSLPWPQACTPVGEIPITLINSQMLPLRLPREVKDRDPLSQEGLRDPTFLQPPRLGTNRTGQFMLMALKQQQGTLYRAPSCSLLSIFQKL